MGLLRLANSPSMNAIIISAILVFVIVMPLADTIICRKLGLNLNHGIGQNSKMDRLLRLRQCILLLVFILYVLAYCYLVFFARGTGQDYSIHIDPLTDLTNAVQFDFGFAELLAKLFNGDFSGIADQIHVVKPDDISQALMNVMLYVPLGYLLPYVFKWFRKNRSRTIFIGILCSALTENMQLIFKRGCYDFDDMLFNTAGCIIGVLFYRVFAYAVTHPDWRKDLQYLRCYQKNARKTALFRMASKMDCGRITIPATQEEIIYSFFVETLGFRLRGQHVDQTSEKSTLLLELGGLMVEFLCSNKQEELPVRTIVLSSERLDRVRKRLESRGIRVSDYETDSYSKHRSMSIDGPDKLRIVFIEY